MAFLSALDQMIKEEIASAFDSAKAYCESPEEVLMIVLLYWWNSQPTPQFMSAALPSRMVASDFVPSSNWDFPVKEEALPRSRGDSSQKINGKDTSGSEDVLSSFHGSKLFSGQEGKVGESKCDQSGHDDFSGSEAMDISKDDDPSSETDENDDGGGEAGPYWSRV